MNSPLNILFVCTGNTCRSVLAQAFLERMLREIPGKKTEARVLSAGVAAVDGLTASREALQVLRQHGIDYSTHRSGQVTPELLAAAHYIFTMTRGQKNYLLQNYPGIQDKIWLLKEYATGSSGEVSDPFGRGLQAYRQAAAEIREALQEIVARWSGRANKEEK